MPAYLTLEEFQGLTVFAHVAQLEAEHPGWIEAQLEAVSDDIDSRLRKRYPVPFAAPYPRTIKRWLARIVTRECYLRRGMDPTDQQWPSIEGAANKAEAEILEAADSVEGLFDLPATSSSSGSAVQTPRPLFHTWHSPYEHSAHLARRGRRNDRDGSGSRG